jgi:hypothetical protein
MIEGVTEMEPPVHQHYTILGAVDCHVYDCDVYEIQRKARRGDINGASRTTEANQRATCCTARPAGGAHDAIAAQGNQGST